MELCFNDSILGEYDNKNERVSNVFAFDSIGQAIASILGGIIAFCLLANLAQCGIVSCFSCMGCNNCLSCESCVGCSGCSSCEYDYPGKSCSEYGYDCRQGCGLTKCDDASYTDGNCRNGCFSKKSEIYYVQTSDGRNGQITYSEKTKWGKVYFSDYDTGILYSSRYEFKGLYKDSSRKELIMNSNYEIIGKLKDGKTYYAYFVEYGAGEQIEIEFVDYDNNDIIYGNAYFSVGQNISKFNLSLDLGDKELEGIYSENNDMVFDCDFKVQSTYEIFHLYQYGNGESISQSKVLRLYVKTK